MTDLKIAEYAPYSKYHASKCFSKVGSGCVKFEVGHSHTSLEVLLKDRTSQTASAEKIPRIAFSWQISPIKCNDEGKLPVPSTGLTGLW